MLTAMLMATLCTEVAAQGFRPGNVPVRGADVQVLPPGISPRGPKTHSMFCQLLLVTSCKKARKLADSPPNTAVTVEP